MKKEEAFKNNILISSDMEGLPGLMSFNEADKTNQSYFEFQQIMTNEVSEMCDILAEKNYSIIVNDSHEDGRNILLSSLNENTTIIRGWNDSIKEMVYGFDANTKGVILHGYHSAGGTNESTVAHTINKDTIEYIKLNGKIIGETTIAIYTCALFNIPVFFITGDKSAVLEAQSINPNIIGLITKEFDGNSVISKSPYKAILELTNELDTSVEALENCPEKFSIAIPKELNFELKFKVEDHRLTKKSDVNLIDSHTITYQTDSFQKFLELLR